MSIIGALALHICACVLVVDLGFVIHRGFGTLCLIIVKRDGGSEGRRSELECEFQR